MRIEISADSIRDFGASLDAKASAINLAMARAINRAAVLAKTQSKRAIAQQVSIKSGTIGAALSLTKATSRDLRAIISTPRRGMSLAKYKNAQAFKRGRGKKGQRDGIRVTVKPGSTKVLKSAFYMRGNIMMRYGGRLHKLYGPSISQVWNKTRDVIRPEIDRDLDAMAREELRFILTGSRR